MRCWESACGAEKLQFQAISKLFSQSPHLIRVLFHPSSPQLNGTPEDILQRAKGLSSGDYRLLKIAVDLWCGSNFVSLHDCLELEPDAFCGLLGALLTLGPKPSKLSQLTFSSFKAAQDFVYIPKV